MSRPVIVAVTAFWVGFASAYVFLVTLEAIAIEEATPRAVARLNERPASRPAGDPLEGGGLGVSDRQPIEAPVASAMPVPPVHTR